MSALLQILWPILQMAGLMGGGMAARAGITRLLAKTALPAGLKSVLPWAGDIGVWSAPTIYDALKTPTADDGMISSNHGQMSQLNNLLASPSPPPDNLSALMELMAQERSGQGDDLMSMLQQQVI